MDTINSKTSQRDECFKHPIACALAVLAGICLLPASSLALDTTDVIMIGVKSGLTENELVRLDRDGNVLWQTTIPVSPFSPQNTTVDRNLTEDAVYLVDTGPDENTRPYNLLKFDRHGTLVWQKPLGPSFTWISANPVAGGVYATTLEGVSLIDGNGTKVWGPINWSHSGFHRVTTDVTTGGFFVSSRTEHKAFKGDRNGNLLWIIPMNDPGTIRCNPVDGGAYVFHDYYQRTICRIDAAGNEIWSYTGVPSYYNFGIAVSPLDGSVTVGGGWPFTTVKFGMGGNVVYTNPYYGDFQIDPDIETGGFYGSSSSGAFYSGLDVRKFDAEGQVVWEKPIGHVEWPRFMIVLTGVASRAEPVLLAPTNLAASPGDHRVTLTWTASDGAEIYAIKRSTAIDGPYATVAEQPATAYVDERLTNRTTYYYMVSAIAGALESPNSTAIQAIPAGPPAITVPGDFIVDATSAAGATVTFSATAVDDCGDSVPVTSVPASGSLFPIGTTTVVASATDTLGATSTASFAVAVRDTTPPLISGLTATPNVLWPPNHKMVPITISAVVRDAVDGRPTMHIVAVTSNEPANGTGDGDTSPDWLVTGDRTLLLRAERSGGGSGRTYTIAVASQDMSGNTSTGSVTVSVPHNRSGK